MAEPVSLPGQPEAERLLAAAVAAPAHAYLIEGPPGSGLDAAAVTFATAVLDTTRHRVEDEIHPDLTVVEREGEEIRVDQVHRLLHDLAMRPFEAARRLYVVREVERLHQDAANALLKSLEEPPSYVTFVLLSEEPARILPTIRSRCQVVRLRRLSSAAIAAILAEAPQDGPVEIEAVARSAMGNIELARRLAGSAEQRAWREQVLAIARAALVDPTADAGDAAAAIMARVGAAGAAVEALLEAERDRLIDELELGRAGRREVDRIRSHYKGLITRRRRRAELLELRGALDIVETYVRDLLCVGLGAEGAVAERALLDELRVTVSVLGVSRAEQALRVLGHTRETLLLPVDKTLALQAMFHRFAALRPAEAAQTR